MSISEFQSRLHFFLGVPTNSPVESLLTAELECENVGTPTLRLVAQLVFIGLSWLPASLCSSVAFGIQLSIVSRAQLIFTGLSLHSG